MNKMPGVVSGLKDSLPVGACALELFVRDGSLVTSAYAHLVNLIYGIDICEEYLKAFKINFPEQAVVVQGDSIEFLRTIDDFENPLHEQKFDLVVVDNPQGIFGKEYAEHFDVLPKLSPLLRPKSCILLCVNLCPYSPTMQSTSLDSYGMTEDGHKQWMQRRNEFYGVSDASDLPIDWMIRFYSKYLENLYGAVKQFGVDIRKSVVQGHKNHIAYLLFKRQ